MATVWPAVRRHSSNCLRNRDVTLPGLTSWVRIAACMRFPSGFLREIKEDRSLRTLEVLLRCVNSEYHSFLKRPTHYTGCTERPRRRLTYGSTKEGGGPRRDPRGGVPALQRTGLQRDVDSGHRPRGRHLDRQCLRLLQLEDR